MNARPWIFVVVACCAGLYGSAPGEEVSLEKAGDLLRRLVSEARPDDAYRARMEATVAQLGAENFRERETAMREIRQFGRPAIVFLEGASTGANPEIRFRAVRLLRELQTGGDSMPPGLRPAVARLRADGKPALLDDLLVLLGHYNKCIRHVAGHTLRDATGAAHGYSALAPAGERQAAVARWEEWRRAHPDVTPSRPASGRLLVNHYEGRFSLVDLDGTVLWSKPYPGRLACVIPTGRGTFLVSSLDDHVLREIDVDLQEQWSWKVPEAAEGGVYGLQQLPGGRLLLGIGYSKQFAAIELDKEREIVWSHPVPGEGDCVVGRALRRPDGSTVLPFEWGNRLVCIDKEGSETWSCELDAPRRLYRLGNGNLLTTSGTAVVELNAEGKPVWEYPCGTHPFDAVRLPDGRTVILVAHRGILVVDVDAGAPQELMAADLRFGSLAYLEAED